MPTTDKDDELTRRQFLLLAGRSAAGAIALGARPGYGDDQPDAAAGEAAQAADRGAARSPVSFVVNGQARTVSVEPRTTLLDALREEPPRAGNPLLELNLPNFIVTPHVAWASDEAMQALADQLIDNLEAFMRGEPRNLLT